MPDYAPLHTAEEELNEYVGHDLINPEEGRDFDHFRSVVSEDFIALGDDRDADAQAATYNKLDENYAAHVCTWNNQKGHTITSSKHIAVANDLLVGSVYDFGFGCGSDLIIMSEQPKVKYVGGHDISKFQADFVEHRFATRDRREMLMWCDTEPPAGNSHWGLVYSIYVLEHLPNPEVAMKWIAEHAEIISLTTQFGKTADHPEHNDYSEGDMDAFFGSYGFKRFYHASRPLMPRMWVKRGSGAYDRVDGHDSYKWEK